MYVIYAAGLFLPGDELRDRLGYAVSSEASAKRKYRELIRQTKPLPGGGALLYLMLERSGFPVTTQCSVLLRYFSASAVASSTLSAFFASIFVAMPG